MSELTSRLGLITVGVMGVASTVIITGQNKRIAKLESENSALNRKLKIAGSKSNNSDNGEIINENKKLIDENKKLVKENKEIRASLSSLMKDNTDKTKEVTALDDIIKGLKEELEIKPRIEIKEVPVEVVKEVADTKVLARVSELETANGALTIRCEGQTAKIKELKGQLRESKNKLKEVQEEFNDFKNQVKLIIETRKEDKDIVKQLTRTVDRVGKKANKLGGK